MPNIPSGGPFIINQSNQSWILHEASVISSPAGTGGIGIYEDSYCSNNKINIYGDVYSTYGIVSFGTSTTIMVMSSSYISAPVGITITGDGGRLTNLGTIDGVDLGVVITAQDSAVVNYGKIFAASVGVQAYGTLVNQAGGVIVSGDCGVLSTSFAGQAKTTYNYGSITGGTVSFEGGAGNDILANRGSLSGEVRLLGGDDTYDGTGGTLTNGAVWGGAGNDTYFINQANILLTEGASGGTDQVYAAVSFTLAANLENLNLTGTAATGTGNTLANLIKGNGSANTLYGMSGNDTIDGAAGSDLLYGGSGADVFVYATNNDIDTIKDFANGTDRIDVKGFSGISSFNDLLYNHAVASGANVSISSSYGKLIIENMTLAQLDATDFIF